MWRVALGSRAGASHAASGTGCQDAYAVHVDGSAFVIAVADGAGSAVRAAEGSHLAANAACAHVVDRFPFPDSAPVVSEVPLSGVGVPSAEVPAVVEVAFAAVAAARAAVGDDRDLASTLAVAVSDGFGLAVAVCGDAGAVVSPGSGLVLCRPDPVSEYSNVTTFLCAPDALDGVRWWWFPGHPPVAVFSDGLDHVALRPGAVPHDGFFLPVFARTSAGDLDVPGLLGHIDVSGRLDDDGTLVVAVPVG